uniref:Cathepsin L n=3 Tax=Lygus hesperus TaxID=30085 RepID=A0A0A9ZFK1_LYGHE
MKAVLLLAVVVATAQAVSFFDLVNDEWELFKLHHKKTYPTEIEERFRMKIFMENKRKIAKHNSRFERGLVKYKMGLNHLSDMLPHEFVKYNGFKRSNSTTRLLGSTFIEPAHVTLPKEVDWREKGAVTPVKNQGQCGSCWSFSATGALEGQHFRKTKKLVPLSEQNLIDCSGPYGNNGCNGGMMDYAFQYIKENRGVDTEKTYPYEAEDDQCRFKKSNVGALDTGFADIPQGDEEKLKAAVATVGPVSVAIDASHESFQMYQSGLYYEPECSSEELDHGVLVVGYGTTDEGDDFWLVKNSWGESWGDAGYIKMARNKDNNCGIATSASYPLV